MPRLSYDTPFRAEDIMSITPLTQQQPVWLMTGLGDSTIVIKAEPKGEQQSSRLSTVVEVMRVVSPTARMKILDNSEIMALQKWLHRAREADNGEDEQFHKVVVQLGEHLANIQRVFVKMETLRLTNFEEGNDKASKKIGKALNAPNGLEDMGMIVAADIFNGNNDRFNFSDIYHPGHGTTWNGKKLNYLSNVGNFMIREDGEKAKLVGMDPFDRSSQSADLNENVGDNWPYFIFHPNNRATAVTKIAELCAHDLKKVVGKTTGLITRNRLTKDAGERMAVGMIRGADLIESHFKMKYGKQGAVVPMGLASRARVAGWNWFQGGVTNLQALRNLTGNSRRMYN